MKRIALVQRLDESIKEINLLVKDRSSDDYIVKNDVLYRFENGKELLVIPEEMQQENI